MGFGFFHGDVGGHFHRAQNGGDIKGGKRGNWSVKEEGTRTECKFPEKNVNFVHLHDRAIFGWDIYKICDNTVKRFLFRPESEEIWTTEC